MSAVTDDWQWPYLKKFYEIIAGLDVSERHNELIDALEHAWRIESGSLTGPFPNDDREEAARKLLTLMEIEL
jgi:hypothetical protein